MSNRAKIREEAKKLNPIDDVMFRKMAESIDFCQEILQVILDDPDQTLRKYQMYVLSIFHNLMFSKKIARFITWTGFSGKPATQ